MKKYLFLGLFIILISIPSIALADIIQTGNASAQSSVTNTVNGSNCSSHIEITVNGQKEVQNSTDCGTHSLSNSVTGTVETPSLTPSITQPASDTPTVEISSIPTLTPNPTISVTGKLHPPSLVSVVIKEMQDFFNKFFHMF